MAIENLKKCFLNVFNFLILFLAIHSKQKEEG
jgi:hypothetical protein